MPRSCIAKAAILLFFTLALGAVTIAATTAVARAGGGSFSSDNTPTAAP